MITYITSYENEKLINQAIVEEEQKILKSIVTNEYNFNTFVKQEYEQLQLINMLIVDIDALQDENDEIIQAINNFRMLYTTDLVIVAMGRKVGDVLLHEIFCLGIYNIIIDNLEENLKKCMNKKMTYRDSIKFKIDMNCDSEKKVKTEPIVKEKIIIKNRVKKTALKEVIGFAGTQSRIGTTHNAIACAKFLQTKGNKVALVENRTNETKSFSNIKMLYKEIQQNDPYYFSLSNIDFYPEFDLENLHLIVASDYNFIVIDFGIFDLSIVSEFSRCVVPIILTGAKPWEVNNLDGIFRLLNNNVNLLNKYNYLFNFMDIEMEKDIKESMNQVEHVYLQEYIPDYFEPQNSKIFSVLLQEFLTEEVQEEKKTVGFLKKIGGKLRKGV